MSAARDPLDEQLDQLLPGGSVTAALATIWATVDRERTAAELGGIVDELPGDPHLGGFVLLVRPDDHEPPIALVEPSTEGRIAATLARHGEGPAGRYVGISDAEAWTGVARRATAAGRLLTAVRPGPFGPSRLVLADSRFGPHLVLVDRRAGTIGR